MKIPTMNIAFRENPLVETPPAIIAWQQVKKQAIFKI